MFLSVISSLHASAEDYDLYIARGIQKINEGEMNDALEFLKKALELSPENPEATYYAGIAYSRLDNYKEAEDLFFKTLQLDDTAIDVYLELGRLYYVTSRCDKSEEFLSKFMSLSEDESSKTYATRLVKTCGKEVKERPYRLNIAFGSQYDSNVILEPSNPPVDADRKSDTRALAYITSGATLFEKEAFKLKADYNFYQSLHVHLSNYNVHYHKITPALEIAVSDIFKPSVGYSFEYTLLGGNRYSRYHTYYGKVSMQESKQLSAEAIYEYKDLKYWDSDLFKTNSIRSGHQNTVGLKQYLYLNRLAGDIYYFGDFNRAEESYWSFNGYRIGAELTYKILSPLYIYVSGEYNRRKYRDDFPDFQETRLDRMQQYSIRLTYLLSKRMAISLTESYIINDSNLILFDYKRNITGLFLTVGVL